jgi:hypothetical protein
MKHTFFLILLFVFPVLSAQKGKDIQSHWNENGTPEETISTENWTFQKQGKFNYFISNDKDKIFLTIKIQEAPVQLRVLREGLKLWINMDNKPITILGVHFPLGTLNSGTNGKRSEQQISQAPEVSLITAVAKATTIELIGFKGEERKLKAENPDSFTGSVIIDNQGVLFYRMVLPFEKLPLRNSREGVGAMPFSLGIEYGSAIETMKKNSAPVLVWIKNIRLATNK